MVAYAVFTRERTRDQAALDVYASKAPATLAGHTFKSHSIFGKHETLEGAPIEGAVILEFPSIEAAKAWYDSPAYREASAHRFLGADSRVFIIEGL
jgi:uncharacterized protein (DUF1330 family)